MKNRTEETVEKLRLSKVLEKLWTYLTVDFIMKLPIVAGKDVILVVCDRLSKITHFVATIMECWNTNNFYFSNFIWIFFFFFFYIWMMKRYVTLQSHDVML